MLPIILYNDSPVQFMYVYLLNVQIPIIIAHGSENQKKILLKKNYLLGNCLSQLHV